MDIKAIAATTIPKWQGLYTTKKKGGATNDIIAEVIAAFKDSRGQLNKFAPHLKAATLRQTLKNVWTFWKFNIRYKVDPDGVQMVQEPRALWARKEGDCKSLSIAVMTTLDALGIKGNFRFASYGDNYSFPTHVYVVVLENGKEIPVDCVWTEFGTQKAYTKKWDYSMTDIMRISGIDEKNIGLFGSRRRRMILERMQRIRHERHAWYRQQRNFQSQYPGYQIQRWPGLGAEIPTAPTNYTAAVMYSPTAQPGQPGYYPAPPAYGQPGYNPAYPNAAAQPYQTPGIPRIYGIGELNIDPSDPHTTHAEHAIALDKQRAELAKMILSKRVVSGIGTLDDHHELDIEIAANHNALNDLRRERGIRGDIDITVGFLPGQTPDIGSIGRVRKAKNRVKKKRNNIFKRIGRGLKKGLSAPLRALIKTQLPKYGSYFLYTFITDEKLLAKAPSVVKDKRAKALKLKNFIVDKLQMPAANFDKAIRNGIMKQFSATPEEVLAKWIKESGFKVSGIGFVFAALLPAVKAAGSGLKNLLLKAGGAKLEDLKNNGPAIEDWGSVSEKDKDSFSEAVQKQPTNSLYNASHSGGDASDEESSGTTGEKHAVLDDEGNPMDGEDSAASSTTHGELSTPGNPKTLKSITLTGKKVLPLEDLNNMDAGGGAGSSSSSGNGKMVLGLLALAAVAGAAMKRKKKN